MDTVPRAKRSWIMSRIGSRDTGPELALRSWLSSFSVRLVRHPRIAGSPDLLIPGARVAVFVDGCFWHGCPRHFRPPKSNKRFWAAKIARNIRRDRSARASLRRLGYKIVRVWEHDLGPTP